MQMNTLRSIFLCVFCLAAIIGCGSDSNPLPEVVPPVEEPADPTPPAPTEPTSPQISLSVENALDGTPVEATISILGPDAAMVESTDGLSLLTNDEATGRQIGRISTENGQATVQLIEDASPSVEAPLRLLMQVEASGYVVNTTSVNLSEALSVSRAVKLVSIATPPAGITSDIDETGVIENGTVKQTISLETPFTDSAENPVGRIVINIPENTQMLVRKNAALSSAAEGAFSAQVVYFDTRAQSVFNNTDVLPAGFMPDAGLQTTAKFSEDSLSNMFAFEVRDSEGSKVQRFIPPLPVVTNVSPEIAQAGENLELWMYDEGLFNDKDLQS